MGLGVAPIVEDEESGHRKYNIDRRKHMLIHHQRIYKSTSHCLSGVRQERALRSVDYELLKKTVTMETVRKLFIQLMKGAKIWHEDVRNVSVLTDAIIETDVLKGKFE
jgi:hypothetical protein